MCTGPRERELDLLERDLEDAESEQDRKAIIREMREIERDAAEEEQWREEGRERGWA
jgi:hypothetical protein